MSTEHFKNGVPPLAGEGSPKNFKQQQCITNHQNPIDRLLCAIRDRGGRVEPSGGQWSCTCPAHDDRKPSLSVCQDDDGKALLHCHAGCTPQGVVQSLGMEMRDLFPDDTSDSDTFRPEGLKNAPSVTVTAGSASGDVGFTSVDDAIGIYTRPMGEPANRWVYQDALGQHVGVVLRWNTPKGKEYRPVSLIDGRWQCNGMPGPRLLYRLPELLASDGVVLVCEGEKACEAARACGYIATTSPHGSNSADKADWSVLRGRDVVLVPDLDEAGAAYARVVLPLCLEQDAKRVRVVDLRAQWPDLEKGDDLADVLVLEQGDASAVVLGLDALIANTPDSSLDPANGRSNSEETAGNPAKGNGSEPFPVEALPKEISTYVMQGARSIGCDPTYLALPVLSMLSGTIGNTHVVEVKDGWIECCTIWTCVVGRSGTAKSPAVELAFKPLQMIQDRLLLKYQEQCRSMGTDSPEPTRKRCLIDDATIEAVMHLQQENPRGMVLRRDELVGWFDFDRYNTGKGVGSSSRWIEMFHGRSISVDRRTKESIFVQRASLSIAGGIQPGILRQLFDPKNLDSGLIARFLLAMPQTRPKVWSQKKISTKTRESMQAIVERLFSHEMCRAQPTDGGMLGAEQLVPKTIRLDDEAMALMGGFVNRHNREMINQSDHIAAAWAKLEAYVPRLALVFHLVREASDDPTLKDPCRIDADSISKAIVLVEWFKQETQRVYGAMILGIKADDHKQLVQWIRDRGGRTTVRDLSRGPTKYKEHGAAQRAIDELVELGHGRMSVKPGGRSTEFVLNMEVTAISDSDTSWPAVLKNPQTVTGANGRYPVPSTEEEN